MSDEGNICSFYGAEGETMYYENDDKTQPRLMPGVYEKKLADWDNYGLTTGVRKLDLMQNQKWNWERHAESPDRAANRAIAAGSAFDGNLVRILRLDSESEEGRIYAAAEPNIMAELTDIIIGAEAHIHSSSRLTTSPWTRLVCPRSREEWTRQYKDYASR